MSQPRFARSIALVAGVALAVSGLTACTVAASTATTGSSIATTATASSLWESSTVHDISITVDDAEYDAMIAGYLADESKEWIAATVTIDGTTIENVGIKLKGNSSLRVVTADSDPATLPWLIRLDEFVEGQSYDGQTELVVRGNSSETALNEAVALELLDLSGLATEEAVASRFTVNGGTTELRLVIQSPNDEWDAEQFGVEGLLYKAEATGDYSYRGDDPELYAEVFEQEAGDDNLEPLIAFLQFINESDDATFATDLDQYLDIESFAKYLAFHDLVDNFDNISGPGNNSYLHYDEATGLMSVVSWDLNLAFGVQNVGGGGGQGGPQGGDRPDGLGGGQAQGGGRGGGPNASNVLADRFLENAEFAALYDAATAELTETLYTSGAAQEVLDQWVNVLQSQASDLVAADVVEQEAAVLEAYFD